MITLERQHAILEYMKKKNSATVKELSQIFFVSETSIRRDLEKMERSGFLQKTYGGAVLTQGRNDVLSLEARLQTEKEAKQIIAQKASGLIHNGDVIFLDSSSTSLAMVPYLSEFTSISIVTNGLKVAVGLAEHTQLKVYFIGGLVTPNIFSCRGSLACQMLSGIRSDKTFLSPNAVDLNRGVFCANDEEAAIRRMMIQQSQQVILLCNYEKLNRFSAFHLCSLEDIDILVCDRTVKNEWLTVLAEHSVQCM